ncbi:MAG: hypothetical protein R3C27_00355 [Hyphomonadaceae bacterium]
MKFGGLKFLEASHVKDFLAILRWAQNGGDRIAGFRALQLVPGVGPAKASRMLDAVDETGAYGVVRNTAPPAGASEAWDALKQMLGDLQGATWPGDLDLAAQWYRPMMNERYDDARVRAGDIDQMQRIGATFGSRTSFLTELTLDPPNSTSDESGKSSKDDDYLILLDHPLGQRAGVEECVRAECCRWLHAVGSRDGYDGGVGGRAAAALCGDDAGEG